MEAKEGEICHWLVIFIICVVIGMANVQSATPVRAAYNFYYPEKKNWDLMEAATLCWTWDASKPMSRRQKYGWASLCGPAGPTGQAVIQLNHGCNGVMVIPFYTIMFQVTNGGAGARAVARIVDQCGNDGLDMDQGLFAQLDTDGSRYAWGAYDGGLPVRGLP